MTIHLSTREKIGLLANPFHRNVYLTSSFNIKLHVGSLRVCGCWFLSTLYYALPVNTLRSMHFRMSFVRNILYFDSVPLKSVSRVKQALVQITASSKTSTSHCLNHCKFKAIIWWSWSSLLAHMCVTRSQLYDATYNFPIMPVMSCEIWVMPPVLNRKKTDKEQTPCIIIGKNSILIMYQNRMFSRYYIWTMQVHVTCTSLPRLTFVEGETNVFTFITIHIYSNIIIVHNHPAEQFSIPISRVQYHSWWRHQMDTFSALLAFCVGNSPATGEFPSQRPVTWNVNVFFDLRLNRRLSKQSRRWWFETPSRLLWGHCNVQGISSSLTKI